MGIHPSIVAFIILLILAGVGVMIIRGNKGSLPAEEGFKNREAEACERELQKCLNDGNGTTTCTYQYNKCIYKDKKCKDELSTCLVEANKKEGTEKTAAITACNTAYTTCTTTEITNTEYDAYNKSQKSTKEINKNYQSLIDLANKGDTRTYKQIIEDAIKDKDPSFSDEMKTFYREAQTAAQIAYDKPSLTNLAAAQGGEINPTPQATYVPSQTIITADMKLPQKEDDITIEHSEQPDIPSLSPSVRSMIRKDVDTIFNQIKNEYEIKYT
jgi:hypothetical protein